MTYVPDNPTGEPEQYPSETSTSLLGAARDHVPSAWERLVKLYSPLVYGWIRRRGLQPADAADVLQEVMRSVAGSLENFRRNQPGQSFRRWLSRITQRRVDDFFRNQGRTFQAAGGSTARGILEDLAGAESPGSSTGTCQSPAEVYCQQYEHVIERVRGQFSEQNWQIFWSSVVQEQDTAEVAQQFGVTSNVVRLAKSRILRRLRDALLEHHHETDQPPPGDRPA